MQHCWKQRFPLPSAVVCRCVFADVSEEAVEYDPEFNNIRLSNFYAIVVKRKPWPAPNLGVEESLSIYVSLGYTWQEFRVLQASDRPDLVQKFVAADLPAAIASAYLCR